MEQSSNGKVALTSYSLNSCVCLLKETPVFFSSRSAEEYLT